MNLLAVDEARNRMLAAAPVLGAQWVDLAAAQGRRLARDVVATRNQPPFPASAMDGWAVRAIDGAGRRRIIGESAAGHGFKGLVGPGEAVRIFTGAAVPTGADIVVIQEVARREGDAVTVPAPSPPSHIRPVGQDFSVGQSLLRAGEGLDPWRLALAAAAGLARVNVARRPRVAILSTGDEIVSPGVTPGPFQIFNSGATALSALVALWGGTSRVLPNVEDSLDRIAAAVASAQFDLLVTLGGASVGDHDLVKPALESLGLRLMVGSVAVRPGKPTWFGALGDAGLVLGLPGNPASALVCAELFLKPLLLAMQGAPPEPTMLRARTTRPLAQNGAREHWMRAALRRNDEGVLLAEPFGDQDSSLVTVFAGADALLRRGAGEAAAALGDLVDVLALSRSG